MDELVEELMLSIRVAAESGDFDEALALARALVMHLEDATSEGGTDGTNDR